MSVYRNRQFRISRKHPLYGCCDTVTALCCNLENAVRFRLEIFFRKTHLGNQPAALSLSFRITAMLSSAHSIR